MSIDWTGVAVWGVCATIVLTSLMSLSQALGLSRVALPYLLGTVFTTRRARAMWLGMLVHGAIGLLFAFFYALVFEQLGRATWWIGAIVGLVQGVWVLAVALPALAEVHPRMASRHHGPTPTRLLEPPGFFAANYGRFPAITTLIAHVVFGTMLGAFYRVGA